MNEKNVIFNWVTTFERIHFMVNGVQFAVSSVDWMKMIGCFAQP